MTTELLRFMDRVGATDAEVSEATGLSISGIWRLKHGHRRPSASTAFILHAWAAERAVKARLRVAERLSWEGLVGE